MSAHRTIRLRHDLTGITSPNAKVLGGQRGTPAKADLAAGGDPPSGLVPSPAPSGPSQPQHDLQPLLADLRLQLTTLENNRAAAIEELQQTAIELATIVAEQLAGELLERDADRLRQLVEAGLARLPTTAPVTVRVHPADYQRLVSLADAKWPETLQWSADTDCKRGTCLLEGPDFGLLSTLEDRIDEIRQALREGIGDAQAERRRTPTEDQTMRRFPDRRETA